MKEVLFLGRIAGVYKTNRKDLDYIAEELILNGFNVDIYDPKKNVLVNLKTSTSKNVRLLPNLKRPKIIQRMLSFMNLMYFCIIYRNKYDYVQVNYVREEYLLIPGLIRKLGENLKIFIYGDDINIRSKIKNNFRRFYSYADEIILTNRNIFKINRQYFPNPEIIEGKLKILYLPQVQLTTYENFSIESKKKAKEELGLSDKRVLIAGISSHPNEQHDKIIKGISTLKNPEKYHVIFPLSTREFDNSGWIKKVKTLSKQYLRHIEHTFMEGYKTIEEVANYRIASDLLINLRERDQLNAALIESNYAYCQVISGSWLPYEDYWMLFKTEKVDNPSELSSKIQIIFKSTELKEKLIFNRKVAENNYSYRVVRKWIALYNKY